MSNFRFGARPHRARRALCANILGIRTQDPVRLVRLIRAGFPFSRLARFQKVSCLPWDRIADLVQIPPRTLTRRQTAGRLLPDESDRVLRASTIFDLATELFEGDLRQARRWLETPQPGLGGEVPLRLAETGVGAREVERLIARLEHGVFP